MSRDVVRTNLVVGREKNRFTRIEVEEGGALYISYEARVMPTHQVFALDDVELDGPDPVESETIPYLFPSRYVPSDRLRAAALDLFGGIRGRLKQVIAIEEWLFQNLFYVIGGSVEQSCTRDTLELLTGVCRDFAHLGITFCRALCIPARYVTVYAAQLYPQDFHAVFEAWVGGVWYIVDGTRKAPLNGMLRIATGLDASDSAVATLFGSVYGQGLEVEVTVMDEEAETFVPIYREELLGEGEILSLC